ALGNDDVDTILVDAPRGLHVADKAEHGNTGGVQRGNERLGAAETRRTHGRLLLDDGVDVALLTLECGVRRFGGRSGAARQLAGVAQSELRNRRVDPL